MLNIAMLGPGRIAENQLAPAIAAAQGIRLWSVFSRDAGRAAEFAERHGAAAPHPAFDDLDRLLADPDLHAVLVASPDRLHAEQTIAAALAGKHVLCEKPMATEVDDARAMVAACREAGVKLGVAYHMRWHAGHRALVESVRAGELGAIRHVRVQWTHKAADAANWRAWPEVGRWWSLAGVGTHCLDQLRWILCPQNGEVTALTSIVDRSVWKSPHDETAVLGFRFASGATAEQCTSVLFAGPRRLEVYGSDGWIVGEDTLGLDGKGRIWSDRGERPFTPVNPYVGEMEDFARAVAEDRPPEVDGEEGLRNVELLVQAIEQARA